MIGTADVYFAKENTIHLPKEAECERTDDVTGSSSGDTSSGSIFMPERERQRGGDYTVFSALHKKLMGWESCSSQMDVPLVFSHAVRFRTSG